MYICIYVYMYACICVNVYVFVNMYICICVYMYICICVYMYICMCVYIYMYMCIYVYLYVCKYAYLSIYTYNPQISRFLGVIPISHEISKLLPIRIGTSPGRAPEAQHWDNQRRRPAQRPTNAWGMGICLRF